MQDILILYIKNKCFYVCDLASSKRKRSRHLIPLKNRALTKAVILKPPEA